MLIAMALACGAACALLLTGAAGRKPARRRSLDNPAPATAGHQRAPDGGLQRLPRHRHHSGERSTGHRHLTFPALPPSPEGTRKREPLRYVTSFLACVCCVIVIGGPVGVLVGMAAGAVVFRSFSRAERIERRKRQARLIADLPVAVDLLAACLRGGTPWSEAVKAVADAVGGPLGHELNTVAARIKLGADPTDAWLALARDPTLAPLARTAIRATQSGAAPAATLARLARDQRRNARTAAATRARSAGIKALAPLGVCFLPAFVLLGVVPAIAGVASTILLPW